MRYTYLQVISDSGAEESCKIAGFFPVTQQQLHTMIAEGCQLRQILAYNGSTLAILERPSLILP